MSFPELEAELRDLWLQTRQLTVTVQAAADRPHGSVPTHAALEMTFVPTQNGQAGDGGNKIFFNETSELDNLFPLFPPFPSLRRRQTVERWWEWSEERMRREEQAAILEFDAGLSRREAEAVAGALAPLEP